MKTAFSLALVVVLSATAALLAACGGRPPPAVGMADVPAFPGAAEMKADNSAIAATLRNNEAQAQATGQKIEQRGFTLPKGATWDKVKSFFTTELGARGWREGVGGALGSDIANQALAQANAGNEMVQTTIFSRGGQTLSITRLVGATKKDEVALILSLSSR